MATSDNYWFPEYPTKHKTPAGEIQIKYWFTSSTTHNYTMGDILEIGPLNIQLGEISPSDKTFRFSDCTFVFANTNNIFETSSSIFGALKATGSFVDLYLDGVVFWRGSVDAELISKEDYYLDTDGTLKYKKVRVKVSDALNHFWKNPDLTLARASYSSSILANTLLDNITSHIGFGPLNTTFDATAESKITEANLAEYTLDDDYRYWLLPTSYSIANYLKDAMLGYGIYMYNLGDNDFWVFSRYGGTTLTVNNNDIISVNLIQNANAIETVSCSTVVEYDTSKIVIDVLQSTCSYEYNTGLNAATSQKYYSLNENNVLAHTYVRVEGSHTSSRYARICDSAAKDYLADGGENFLLENVEPGMILYFNITGSGLRRASINKVSQTRIDFDPVFDCAVPSSSVKAYYIARWPLGDDGFYRDICMKGCSIIKGSTQGDGLADIYYEVLNNRSILQLELYGIDTYKDLYKRFVFNGDNYRVIKASFDFMSNSVICNLMRVT